MYQNQADHTRNWGSVRARQPSLTLLHSPGFSDRRWALAQLAAIDWQRMAPFLKEATWDTWEHSSTTVTFRPLLASWRAEETPIIPPPTIRALRGGSDFSAAET